MPLTWNPITQMPPNGEDVLITNGRSVTIARFETQDDDDSQGSPSHVIMPAEGTITGWLPLTVLPPLPKPKKENA